MGALSAAATTAVAVRAPLGGTVVEIDWADGHTVGNYALCFTWGDGHSAGLYRFELLRRLCACDDCLPLFVPKRSF